MLSKRERERESNEINNVFTYLQFRKHEKLPLPTGAEHISRNFIVSLSFLMIAISRDVNFRQNSVAVDALYDEQEKGQTMNESTRVM